MVDLPARCANGHLFPSGLFNLRGRIERLTIQNVTLSCPLCGAPAAVLNGTYNFLNGILSAADDMSRERLERILASIQSQSGDEATADGLAAAVEPESPEMAQLLRQHLALVGDVGGTIALIIWLLHGILSGEWGP